MVLLQNCYTKTLPALFLGSTLLIPHFLPARSVITRDGWLDPPMNDPLNLEEQLEPFITAENLTDKLKECSKFYSIRLPSI